MGIQGGICKRLTKRLQKKKKKKGHGKEISTEHQEKLLLISGNLEGHTVQGCAQERTEKALISHLCLL